MGSKTGQSAQGSPTPSEPTELKKNGPTLQDWLSIGMAADDYPPAGFEAIETEDYKHWLETGQLPEKRELVTQLSRTGYPVRALKTTYYNHQLHHAGDIFMCDPDGLKMPFEPSIMERVDPGTPTKYSGPNNAIALEHKRIVAEKNRAGGIQETPVSGGDNPLGA